MARLPAALIWGCLTLGHLVASSAVLAQPELILGTDSADEYRLFTPQAVVAAGGGGGGGNLPTPPETGAFTLGADDGTVEWIGAAEVLERDLYDEFRDGTGLQGTIVTIKRFSAGDEAVELGSISPVNVVKAGITGGLSDTAPVAAAAAASAGSGNTASRHDHAHPQFVLPYSTAAPKVAGTAAAGSADHPSRGDHVHPTELPTRTGQAGKVLGLSPSLSLQWTQAAIPAPPADRAGIQYVLGTSATVDAVWEDIRTLRGTESLPIFAGGTTVDAAGDVVGGAGVAVGWDASGRFTGAIAKLALTGGPVGVSTSAIPRNTHTFNVLVAGPLAVAQSHVQGVTTATPAGTPVWWAPGSNAWTLTSASGQTPVGYVLATPTGSDPVSVFWDFRGRAIGGGIMLSNDKPEPLGPAVPGAGTTASRHDHVHPLQASPLPALTGNAKAVLSVNPGATGVEWVSPTTTVLEGAGVTSADKSKLIGANAAGNGIALYDPHAAVLAGLPALAGHGGNALTVNAAETGVEWKAAGGGGSGGTGDLTYTKVVDFSGSYNPAVSSSVNVYLPFVWDRAKVYAIDSGSLGGSCFLFEPDSAATDQSCILGGANNRGTWQAIFVPRKADSNCPNSHSTECVQFRLSPLASGGAFTVTGSIYTVGFPSGGGGGGGTNPSIPNPTAAGQLKHLRVNAAGAAYELADPPPDLSGETETNADGIDHLNRVTADLNAGSPAGAWDDASGIADGAIALLGALPTASTARAISSWSTALSSGLAGKWPVIRLPNATLPSAARLRIVSVDGARTDTFDQLVSGYTQLAQSTDEKFTLYGGADAFDSDASSATVQLTTAAHAGTSSYIGTPTKVAPWALNGNVTKIPASKLPDAHFSIGWVKLFEGSKQLAGGAQIDFDLPEGSGTAILAAQRDTEGMGVYRQFMAQFAWNIGTGQAEELVQAQAILPGVPLDGSVAQAGQGVRYIGTLAGLDAPCPILLVASTTAAVLEGNGSCAPGWGNQGETNPTIFWKLWGQR
ncbi:MAG: hypothetical protein OXG44_13725 [Gammaproteobacteria bacterium]|nr:hypothetical protein [Gammaproteobacteria bacterium]